MNHVEFVGATFDARRSAAYRHYRYTIHASALPSVFLSPFVWHIRANKALDVEQMRAAARSLVSDGEARDYSAFRKTGSMARHTNIMIRSATVGAVGELVVIDVKASWFVYGMMRFIANALVQVGVGKWSVKDFCDRVQLADRGRMLSSAPASGLCLIRVDYGAEDPFRMYGLPGHPCFPASDDDFVGD